MINLHDVARPQPTFRGWYWPDNANGYNHYFDKIVLVRSRFDPRPTIPAATYATPPAIWHTLCGIAAKRIAGPQRRTHCPNCERILAEREALIAERAATP